MTNMPHETCPWSLSGPQFPQPTAIQQRYCYPKGDPYYAGRKGGALWTMYGTNGKEDFQFRLLHVYFSVKRAVNKGVDLTVEDRLLQSRHHDSSSSASITGSTGTAKRSTKRVARSVRSPWQERRRAADDDQSLRRHAPDFRSTKRLRRALEPAATTRGANGEKILLPPTSPFQLSHHLMEAPEGSVYVSPNTAASTSGEHCRSLAHHFDSSFFDHPPFHPVASFDAAEENVKSGSNNSRKNQNPFRVISDRPVLGCQVQNSLASSIVKDESFEFSEAAATVIGGHADNWNDPLLPLDGKPSFDDSENGKKDTNAHGVQSDASTPEKLKDRLGRIHEAIREGILARPRANQGLLLSIVASWARSLAQNPLVPTIRVVDQDLTVKELKSEKGGDYATAEV
jgi:hypothetical protein